MIFERCNLEPDNDKIYYAKYLLDNSEEIDVTRKHPAMIVCPGGGYLGTSDREAEPVAMHYLNKGYQTFVLRYNTAATGNSVWPNPLYDLCKMILIIREHSEAWHIDQDKIGIIGFSAGAHLCASLAVYWQDDWLKDRLDLEDSRVLRPAAVVLGYPLTDNIFQNETAAKRDDMKDIDPKSGISKQEFMETANTAILGADKSDERLREFSPRYHVTEYTPPVFLWHTAADSLVYVGNSLLFARELEKHEVPFELHIFETGEHGLSLANKNTADKPEMINAATGKWVELADIFLERHL